MALRLHYVAGVSPAKWLRAWNERRPDLPLEASRVAVGSRCDYGVEVRGTRGSARWNLERLNELEICLASAPSIIGWLACIHFCPRR